jgi:hypothetical protein
MAHTTITHHRTYGAAILARLASAPAALKAFVKSFRAEHDGYERASVVAEDARAARDAEYEAIAAADHLLDSAVLALADRLVAAGLGARQNPFAAYSSHAPAALNGLPYATEVAEVRKLAKKIAARKPPADVQKTLTACTKAADGVEKALAGLSKPQLAYDKALARRDGLLLGWTKALSRLKKHAAAEWDEDEAQYRATFAPVDSVQSPTKKRAKKKAKPAAVAAPA